VAVSFQALSALVLVHLKAALLLEISHLEVVASRVQSAPETVECNLPFPVARGTQLELPTRVHAPATVEYIQRVIGQSGKNADAHCR